jgi:hypothetical protein
MSEQSPAYRFGPREKRGIWFGRDAGELDTSLTWAQ